MGTVYTLTNEAIRNRTKIGMSSTSLSERMLALENTSIPLPFYCYCAPRVDGAQAIDKTLRTVLGEHRLRTSREFFRIDPIHAKVVLESLAIKDVTQLDLATEALEDAESIEGACDVRQSLQFSLAKIPIGAMSHFAQEEPTTATVLSDETLDFPGEILSLSNAALVFIHELRYTWSTISGPTMWPYDGMTLDERRKSVEGKSAGQAMHSTKSRDTTYLVSNAKAVRRGAR